MGQIDTYWDSIHLKYNSSYDDWLNKYLYLFKDNARVVELGCGRAYNSKYLIDNGFTDITACDISNEVIKMVNSAFPSLKTMVFDISQGLPFEDNSVDIVIADLCLHYFDSKTTSYVFDEIYRVLSNDGLLIARVNSIDDINYIPKDSIEIEKNYYFDGKIYKKFFDFKDFSSLFKGFEVCNLSKSTMDRYDKPKKIWEFSIRKKGSKKR